MPATANSFLLRQVLRQEWGFGGFGVSDWGWIQQLAVHGLTAGDADSSREAVIGGVDMDMASGVYAAQLAHLVGEGRVGIDVIELGRGQHPAPQVPPRIVRAAVHQPRKMPSVALEERLRVAKQAALQSVVLLKNEAGILPLSKTNTQSIAVIGPLADEPYEQLGTWIFDEYNRLTAGKNGARAGMKWFHDHGYGNSGATSGHLIPGNEEALKRGTRIYAEFLGYGIGGEAHHITAPEPNGLVEARLMEEALKEGGAGIDQVDHINAHGSGTPLNDKVESLAIK